MKNYREIADSVFERRAQYVTAQRKRKKLLASAGATLCAVSLLGGSVWYLNRPQHDIPVVPATDDGTVTTTVTTEGEDTTTTTVNTTITTIDTTTDGGVVTPPTTAPTTVPAPSKPTDTKAPTTGKTDPPKTTTTTSGIKDKVVITADEPDNYINDEGALKFISPALLAKMEEYKDVDVKYALKVTIPITSRDVTLSDDFWESNEELAQLYKEYYEVYNAFEEEALRLNPTWDRHSAKTIEVWTDTMQANYEYWLTLVERRKNIEEQGESLYVEMRLNKRYETLKTLCDEEPIDVECTELKSLNVFYHSYYVELTADAIETLAKQSGYYIFFADADYGWVMDE